MSNPPILPLIEHEDASPQVRAVYDDIMHTRGTDWINNFWKVLAHDPATLKRTWEDIKQVMAPGALDPLTKEMIYIAVSATNGCEYCTYSHTAGARAKGMTDAQLMNSSPSSAWPMRRTGWQMGYDLPSILNSYRNVELVYTFCAAHFCALGNPFMPIQPNARSVRAAAALSGNLMLAPAVIALRMPMLLEEARGTSPYRVETTRAVTEKMSAMVEGALAAQMAFANAAMQFWPDVMAGRTPSLVSGVAMDQAVRAALVPSGRVVKSNHRRLSRPK